MRCTDDLRSPSARQPKPRPGKPNIGLLLGCILPLLAPAIVHGKTAAAIQIHVAEVEAGKSRASTIEAGDLYLYPSTLRSIDGGLVSAERGILFVPANRSDPRSNLLVIDFYRFFSSNREADGVPPIVRLHGGPGFGGLDDFLAQPGYYERNLAHFREIADVVVIGQRGAGANKPDTLCGEVRLDAEEAHSAEQVSARLREQARRCRNFWRQTNLDLESFNIDEAADDIDAVRRALGYHQITLWGISFGSHWGMNYIRRHPDRVARAMLGGMEGPDHTYDMPSEVLAAMGRFAAAAESSTALAGRIPPRGLIAAFETVLQRASAMPIEVSLSNHVDGSVQTVRFGRFDIQRLAQGLHGTATRQGIATWPALIIDLYHGQFDAAARSRIDDYDLSRPAMYGLLDCGSGISPGRTAHLASDPASAILGDINFYYTSTCPIWSVDMGETFRSGFQSNVQMVIVQGTWDTSTPIENTRELVADFSNGVLVTVHGGSHRAYWEAEDASPEFVQGMRVFLSNGDTSKLPLEVQLPELDWREPLSRNKTSRQDGTRGESP